MISFVIFRDKETKHRIADHQKEELKSRYEYLRIAVFFFATVGSGSLAYGLKEDLTNKEGLAVIIGFIFMFLDMIYIFNLLIQTRRHLNELKKLEK